MCTLQVKGTGRGRSFKGDPASDVLCIHLSKKRAGRNAGAVRRALESGLPGDGPAVLLARLLQFCFFVR